MKPMLVFLDPQIRTLASADALSVSGITAFRNGGSVNGEKAIPFIEVLPETSTFREVLPAGSAVAKKHPHYHKPMPSDTADVYRVLLAFNVTDPCLQHAVKKLLVAGGRGGGKDISRDVEEAIDTLQRWQEMRAEELPVGKFAPEGVLVLEGVLPLCQQKNGTNVGRDYPCYPHGTCYIKGCVNERAR